MVWFKGNRRVKHRKSTQFSAVESLEARALLAPVKFYAVDDAVGQDSVYKYEDVGTALGSFVIENKMSRGIATVELGDTLWVVDQGNRRVFVYDNNGSLLGSWLPQVSQLAEVFEGIATDGNDIWLLSRTSNNSRAAVHYFPGAASLRHGSLSTSHYFQLPLPIDSREIWCLESRTAPATCGR